MAPICLEVLQWSDLRRAPKQGAGQQPDVLLTLRVSKAAMRGAQYQEEIINQVSLYEGGAFLPGVVWCVARWGVGGSKQARIGHAGTESLPTLSG